MSPVLVKIRRRSIYETNFASINDMSGAKLPPCNANRGLDEASRRRTGGGLALDKPRVEGVSISPPPLMRLRPTVHETTRTLSLYRVGEWEDLYFAHPVLAS